MKHALASAPRPVMHAALANTGLADAQAPRPQEHLVAELMRAGLDEEQARAQVSRLEAGEVWGG